MLGYPCEPKTIHSIFSLLDRNFAGKISARDLQRLRDFRADQLLKSLEALKKFAQSQFGGVDECYQKLILREQALQQLNYVPKGFSFGVFQKLCNQAGLGKGSPAGDPKMLFLFLSQAQASQQRAAGILGANEWSLLKGFDSQAAPRACGGCCCSATAAWTAPSSRCTKRG